MNAIFYPLRTGCQWRYLPREYPNWKTVYSCCWRWQRSGVWERVLEALQPQVRQGQGQGAYPVSYTHLDVYKRQVLYHLA